eukprot:TRINITY_DN26384_c0_g1_i1.p1 TRINITY_DN26384_c0_g1~~TRINITY_DN26384_c0_g1_i1.p1  ORF type:complete len:788 (+),score=156.51 TRINITY_DN26384_c0_g1_i1:38-2365(+)
MACGVPADSAARRVEGTPVAPATGAPAGEGAEASLSDALPLQATFRERLSSLASEYEDLAARHCALCAYSGHLRSKLGSSNFEAAALVAEPRVPAAPAAPEIDEEALASRWAPAGNDLVIRPDVATAATTAISSRIAPAAGGVWPSELTTTSTDQGTLTPSSKARAETRLRSKKLKPKRTTGLGSNMDRDTKTHKIRSSLSRLGLSECPSENSCNLVEQEDRGMDDRIQNLWDVFSDLDKDGQGSLSADDLLRKQVQPGLVDSDAIRRGRYEAAIIAYNALQNPDLKGSQAERLDFQTFVQLMLSDFVEADFSFDIASAIREIRSMFLVSDATDKILKHIQLRSDDLHRSVVQIERLKRLDTVMCVVIVVNATLLGVAVDTPWSGWNFIESVFATIFVAELSYKLRVVGCKEFFLGDEIAWNLIDLFIVVIAVVDVLLWIFGSFFGDAEFGSLTVVRLVRLTRLSRFLRLLRLKAFKELTLIVNGVVAGLRTLFWANILLLLLIYSCGVFLAQTLGTSGRTRCRFGAESVDAADDGFDLYRKMCVESADVFESERERLFAGVPRAMFTVFRCFTSDCTMLDGDSLMMHMLEIYGWPVITAYVLMILFVCFGLFNLIMAIFVESTLENARLDDQRRRAYRRAEHIRLAHNLQRLLLSFSNGSADVHVNREAFDLLIEDPIVRSYLDDMEVAKFNRGDLFDILDADGNGVLDMTEVIDGIMKMRGVPDKSDVVATLLAVKSVHKNLRCLERVVHSNFTVISDHLARVEVAAGLGSPR